MLIEVSREPRPYRIECWFRDSFAKLFISITMISPPGHRSKRGSDMIDRSISLVLCFLGLSVPKETVLRLGFLSGVVSGYYRQKSLYRYISVIITKCNLF